MMNSKSKILNTKQIQNTNVPVCVGLSARAQAGASAGKIQNCLGFCILDLDIVQDLDIRI